MAHLLRRLESWEPLEIVQDPLNGAVPRCGHGIGEASATSWTPSYADADSRPRTLIAPAYPLMCTSVMDKNRNLHNNAAGERQHTNMETLSDHLVQFVALPDGRRIAYRTQGTGPRSLLVLHGLGCSRVAGMPGVSGVLLEEMGVRIVSIDRPGYGLSDFNPAQTWETFCRDLVHVADALELGEKIWLLGYSCGGAYCWAAARYIPERIAGIAMWAPAGNYYWKGISETERKKMIRALNLRTRSTYGIVRKVPVPLQWMCYAYVRYLVVPAVGSRWVEGAKSILSAPDAQNLQHLSGAFMAKDTIESARQGGKGLAQDGILVCSDWGFELSEVRERYHGSIHIFNGDQDLMVPLGLQRCVKRMLPDHVHLHNVEGEGHISAFCYNDKIHRKTLESLFGSSATEKVDEDHDLHNMRVGDIEKGGRIVSGTVKGPPVLNAPYRILITVCILALFKLSILV